MFFFKWMLLTVAANAYTLRKRHFVEGELIKEEATRSELRVRPGNARDIRTILSMIRGLAEYERLASHVGATPARIRRDGFGRRPYFKTLICQEGPNAVGFALYFFTYSTFLARPTLYVEDLFVLPPAARAKARVKPCLASWLALPSGGDAAGWNGRCSTGMPERLRSTGDWARDRGRSGSSRVLQAALSAGWREATSNLNCICDRSNANIEFALNLRSVNVALVAGR